MCEFSGRIQAVRNGGGVMKKAALGVFSLAVLAVVALSLSACAPTQALQGSATVVQPQYLIVPGVRIGNYTLDRTLQSYLQEFGPNPVIERNVGGTGADSYFWPARGVSVSTRDNAVIAVYIITQVLRRGYAAGEPEIVARQRELERYRTLEGLALGQPVAQVKALYGEPEQISPTRETDRFRLNGFVYGRIGLWVTIEAKATPGTVTTIGVFRPGTPRWW